jgi:hypothetical protein
MYIPNQYTYAVVSVVVTGVWLVLFWNRKDLRKDMWFVSLIMGANNLIAQYFWYSYDWFKPFTITGTRVGIEDFILGFSLGGVTAVLYPEIFREKLHRRKISKLHSFTYFILLFNVLIGFLYWGFHIRSSIASIIVYLLLSIVVMFERKDLFKDALVSGLVIAVNFILLFHFINFISPGWTDKAWLSNSLSGACFLNVPLEDIACFFLYGFFIGPLYEFVHGVGLRKYIK